MRIQIGLIGVVFLVLAWTVPGLALDIVLEPDNVQREIGGKVRVHIYADNAIALISMGVKVSFDASVLQVIEASKFEDVPDGWLMDGDGDPLTTGDQYNNPAVEIDNTAGTVTMIGGHLVGDTNSELSGKILLGWIVFEAKANGDSNINIDLGKYHPSHPTETFDNFVNTNGTVDEPTNLGDLGTICVVENACEGDVNRDGVVNSGDSFKFKTVFPSSFGDGKYDPSCDLNGDGIVNPGDSFIFRSDFPRNDCPNCPTP